MWSIFFGNWNIFSFNTFSLSRLFSRFKIKYLKPTTGISEKVLEAVESKNITFDLMRGALNTLEDLKFLLKCGADVNIKNESGTPLLHFAFLSLGRHKFGNNECFKILMEHPKINPNAKDSDGDTIIHYLLLSPEFFNYIEVLMEYPKIDVNAEDSKGNTALHIACNYINIPPHLPLAKLLIKKGADLHAQNSEGNTPLHIACHNTNTIKNQQFIKLLIEKGGSIMDENKAAETPVDIILKSEGDKRNKEILISYLIQECEIGKNISQEFLKQFQIKYCKKHNKTEEDYGTQITKDLFAVTPRSPIENDTESRLYDIHGTHFMNFIQNCTKLDSKCFSETLQGIAKELSIFYAKNQNIEGFIDRLYPLFKQHPDLIYCLEENIENTENPFIKALQQFNSASMNPRSAEWDGTSKNNTSDLASNHGHDYSTEQDMALIGSGPTAELEGS